MESILGSHDTCSDHEIWGLEYIEEQLVFSGQRSAKGFKPMLTEYYPFALGSPLFEDK